LLLNREVGVSRFKWLRSATSHALAVRGRVLSVLVGATVAQMLAYSLWFWDPGSPGYRGFFLSRILPALMFWSLIVFLRAVVFLQVVRGTKTTHALLLAGSLMPKLLVVDLIYFLLVIGGCLLLVVPGLLIGARLSVASIEVIITGKGPLASLLSSYRRTRGLTWQIVGFLLCFVALGAAVGLAFFPFLERTLWGFFGGMGAVLVVSKAITLFHKILLNFFDTVWPVYLFYLVWGVGGNVTERHSSMSCPPQKPSPTGFRSAEPSEEDR